MLQLPFRYKAVTTILLVIAAAIVVIAVAPKDKQEPSYYRPYLGLLKEVYDVMDRDYYKPVSKEAYDDYLIKYKESILGKLTDKEKVVDMVMWRGAGLLVERLRDPRDRFTSFIPPKMAENYEKNIYGFEYDLGISGNLTKDGYLITFVEKRSDAFKKGIKPGWVILEIDGKALAALKEDDIKKLLSPPKDATARLMMLLPGGQKAQAFELVSTKYFKETVFNVPTGMDGTYCFQIAKFNEQTSADMRELIVECQKKGIKFLILDLRNNPGGPPLAVRELAGLFLKPGSNLFYYKKKNIAPFGLITPNSDVHYGGPILVMVNKMSGSSSEVFAGVLKEYKRAVIVGPEQTAGMAFLKGVHKFGDGSMLALITGMSYLFNDKELDYNGVAPSLYIPKELPYDEQLPFVLDKLKNGK